MEPDLYTLLSHPFAPSLIYYHHPHHPSSSSHLDLPPRCQVINLDPIEHFNARIFYTSAIRQLDQRSEGEVTTWDGFTRVLREVWRDKASPLVTGVNGVGTSRGAYDEGNKGKGKAKETIMNGHTHAHEDDREEKGHIVFFIGHAERLRHVFGINWAVVTRMAELTGLPMTVVLASSVPWDEIRPPRGDAPEPIQVYRPAPSRDEVIKSLLPSSSHPLFPRFLDLLIASLLPLLSYPLQDLGYLAEPLWRIYTSHLPAHAEQTLFHRSYPDPANPPPPLQITVRLLTDLKHQMAIPLAAAMEDLVPGQVGREEFVRSIEARTAGWTPRSPGATRQNTLSDGLSDLPLGARFLLVAGYCASYNPAKSDLRLFGRGTGPDGKRRRGGGTRRAGYGRTRLGKIPQRLLGPKPFPLDRLLAIFASLYAEHAPRPADLEPSYDYLSDDQLPGDDWLPSVEQARRREERKRKRDNEREELWSDEVDHLTMSVRSWSLIAELETQGLIRRVSPVDRLDNVMLRCEIDYETATALAKDLKLTLDEYMYEATA